MTKRQALYLIYMSVVIISVVVGATTFYYYQAWHLNFLKGLYEFFFFLSLLALVVALFYILVIRKGFKRFMFEEKIYSSVERNLISIGAYYQKPNQTNIYSLPKIRIDNKNQVIQIDLKDVSIRKRLETYTEQLSSALPETLIVKDCFINNTATSLIVKYRDEATETQKTYNNLEKYTKHIDYNNQLTLEIDEEHAVNLRDYPHWIILGSTGSGKSFLAQLLLIQAVRKNFDVSIFDVKRSYSAFADVVDIYETEPDRIIEQLKQIAEEMRERQNNLSEHLKYNPRILAVNCGYRPKIVLIEEYIGLKTLLNKDQTKELDNIVKEISVLARSVNISLVIVAQSSSVDIIDSAIKNNLNKIFLGHLASNIQVSTFGTGVEVPLFNEIKKGYGYIQLDRVEQIKVPNVIYSVDELKKLDSRFCEGKGDKPFTRKL